jgi:hypothetical protein
MNTVDHQIYQQVSQELQQGEHIEWIGQPYPGRYARGFAKIVLFALPWTAFSLFWIAAAAGFRIPDFREGFDFFPLFGLPFLLIGITMLLRPLREYFKAHRIVYAVTNRRALILQLGKSKKITGYSIDEIGQVTRIENAEGIGDLYFSVNSPVMINRTGRFRRIGFRAIAQPKQAEAHLQALLSKKG